MASLATVIPFSLARCRRKEGAAAMIPVARQPEPEIFDEQVRKRGKHWLREQAWPLDAPPVDASQLPAYWRETQKELWTA